MEEIKTRKSYYQLNKELYKKGGKYYKYVPVDERTKTGIKIKHGKFIIFFN
tara:strand:- start:1353 stop:1505 length:153 start_codon:yes stop_codon:yes gene_type:complete